MIKLHRWFLVLLLIMPAMLQSPPVFSEEPQPATEKASKPKPQEKVAEDQAGDDFKPSEEISEDFPAPMPADI